MLERLLGPKQPTKQSISQMARGSQDYDTCKHSVKLTTAKCLKVAYLYQIDHNMENPHRNIQFNKSLFASLMVKNKNQIQNGSEYSVELNCLEDPVRN